MTNVIFNVKTGPNAILTFFKFTSPTGVIGKFPHQILNKWRRNKSLEILGKVLYPHKDEDIVRENNLCNFSKKEGAH